MPRIPTAADLGARPAPQIDRTVTALEVGTPGRAAQQIGKTIVDTSNSIAETLYKRELQTRALEYKRKDSEWYLANVLDPETGLESRKGKDAAGTTADLLRRYREFRAEASRDLPPALQAQVEEWGLEGVERLTRTGSAHETKETNDWHDGESKASLESTIAMAASSGDPGTAESGPLADAHKIVSSFAARKRLTGSEQEKQMHAEAVSGIHAGVLDGLLAANSPRASSYFAEHKKELGVLGPKYERQVRLDSVRTIGQSARDHALKAGMSENQALAWARQNYTGEEETAAVAEIKTVYGERESGRERYERDASDQAYQIFAKTQDFNAIPVRVLDAMDGHARETLRQHSVSVARGEDVKTDYAKYEYLRTAIHEDAAAVDLKSYINDISGSDLQELNKLREAVITGGPAADKAITDEQLISGVADIMGWEGTRNAVVRGVYAATLRTELRDAAKGGTLGYAAQREIAERVAIRIAADVETRGWNKPLYKHLTPENVAAARAALAKKQKTPPTQKQIEDFIIWQANR